MSAVQYLLLGMALAAVPACLVIWWLRGKLNLSGPLAEVQRALSDSFGRANADMAARVEQIKGDLRSELADRLQKELKEVRETVERQLTAGREEQSRRLTELKTAQVSSASEARSELGRNLEAATTQLQKRFEALESKTEHKLESIRNKVDERLQQMTQQVQQKLEKNIQEGFAHFEKVQEHLKAAEEQLRNVGAVGHSINELNSLLKLPHLRGKFGEAELGKLLADFLPAGTFEEQATIVPESKETVDAIVKFPNAKLPIDSKFNREQILPLFETSDPEKLKDARKQLAVVIKQQAQSISEKYVRPEQGTTDLGLMFLPSETIYFEVIRNVELCESLHKLKVFPVSPNTLAITLKSAAMSFGLYEFSRNVDKTLEQIKQAQRSFGLFQKKFEEVGKGLEKAQEAYGTAAGHLNRYTNRVVKLTGEAVPDQVETPALTETTPELLPAPELEGSSADAHPNGRE